MATHTDILIIGGGIAGIGAAARLADIANVTVLEREKALGYHSTGRSAAIFIKNYGNSIVRTLNAASEPELVQPDLVSDFSLLSPRGEMLIACEEDMAALDAYLDDAEDMERLTPKEAGELVPILNTERLAGAAIERGAQEIDVDRLLQGYVRLSRTRGVKIVIDTRVTGLSRNSGQWIVQTPRDSFVAPVVINAAGAWADDIAHKAGLAPLGLQGLRRSAALIPAPEGHDTSIWPLFAAASEGFYAKPDAGHLMVSPADEDPVEPHDVWADDMVLAEGLHRYEQAVNVPVTRILHNWAGLRTFAPDRIPVVGFDPREDGFFWLAGQGGYGIQTAPALSRLTANLIAETTPGLARHVVAALSPNRLLKG